MARAAKCSGPISLDLSTLSLKPAVTILRQTGNLLEASPGRRRLQRSDRRSCITPAAEEVWKLYALRCIRKRSYGSGVSRAGGFRWTAEDLCQRCGSLPALLAALAV